MTKSATIGILGGMGPQATNKLGALITTLTPAQCDQEHIPVITYNNCAIPSRLDAVLRGAASPLPELIRSARVLQESGADFIIMPCNAAHFYLDEMRDEVSIPILDMVEHTVDYIVANHPDVTQVGILASSATIESRLYLHPFLKHAIALLTPLPSHQRIVMEAVYGEEGLKAGQTEAPRKALYTVSETLIECGAEVVLAGCVEVSLVFENEELPFTFIDPLQVMARVAIAEATSGRYGSSSLRAASAKV